jgi:N-acetylglucosamine kinase-like BadF-type ATPase
MEIILAIDGGGSRTRCLAITRDARIIGEHTTGPSNHLLVERDLVRRSLSEAIDETLARCSLSRNAVAGVAAGLAGVDFDGHGRDEMDALLTELDFPDSVINGDMVIAHAGALGHNPGIVALAGTGSVILGIGPTGERVKVGGWGPIYGDEGSGYRIGEQALRAAAQMYDGRGPHTGLLRALSRAMGVVEFRETVARVYVETMEPREIAALTPIAYEVAQTGDEVARRIFLEAGDDLAESVEAAARQLKSSSTGMLVSYQGSVLESCGLLRERFDMTLRRLIPGCRVLAPRFQPVIGAYLLGREALGWEVNDEVIASLALSKSYAHESGNHTKDN